MSFSVNRVTLLGVLGRDPEFRNLQNGNTVANLSVATEQSWKDKGGVWQKKTEWHRVVAWGGFTKLADKLSKGSKVYVEGSLTTRKYVDKDGQDKYSTDIVVQGMDAKLIGLDGRNGNSGGQEEFGSKPQPRSALRPPTSEDVGGDEIPF